MSDLEDALRRADEEEKRRAATEAYLAEHRASPNRAPILDFYAAGMTLDAAVAAAEQLGYRTFSFEGRIYVMDLAGRVTRSRP